MHNKDEVIALTEKKGEAIHVVSDAPVEDNSITFFIGEEAPEEMLKICPEGFYVRGKKVEQDEEEAQQVYDAFIEWLEHQNALKAKNVS